VVKGNYGEISVLAGADAEVRGVESITAAADLPATVKLLAARHKCTAVATGAVDVISDGKKSVLVHQGHALMGQVVGTGCMSTSVLGCFCAVEKDWLAACATGLAAYGRAGELAAAKAAGPGDFIPHLFNVIAELVDNGEALELDVEEVKA
jgi:hydroxyethylthiazole kinase